MAKFLILVVALFMFVAYTIATIVPCNVTRRRYTLYDNCFKKKYPKELYADFFIMYVFPGCDYTIYQNAANSREYMVIFFDRTPLPCKDMFFWSEYLILCHDTGKNVSIRLFWRGNYATCLEKGIFMDKLYMHCTGKPYDDFFKDRTMSDNTVLYITDTDRKPPSPQNPVVDFSPWFEEQKQKPGVAASTVAISYALLCVCIGAYFVRPS